MGVLKNDGFPSPVKLAAVFALMASFAFAETVHQSVPADKFQTGDGKNAITAGAVESKTIEGAGGGLVARLKGSVQQWGFVNCWFGLPAPQGKSIIRFHIYVDSDKVAKTLLYIRGQGGADMVGELKLPADAKEKTFVDVDVPVDAKEEWSGLVIKKAEASNAPGFWIQSVSVVLPD